MSRSPRIEIESRNFKELILLSKNSFSDIERKFGWSHDYLADCVRKGWISQSRLRAICDYLGVDERMMRKSHAEKKPRTSDEALIRFCDDMACAWARYRDNLRGVDL